MSQDIGDGRTCIVGPTVVEFVGPFEAPVGQRRVSPARPTHHFHRISDAECQSFFAAVGFSTQSGGQPSVKRHRTVLAMATVPTRGLWLRPEGSTTAGGIVTIRFKRVSRTEVTVKASTVSEIGSVLRRLGIDASMATGDVKTLARLDQPISPRARAIATRPAPKVPAKRAPKIPTTRVRKTAAKKTARKAAAKRTAKRTARKR
jgi:hypothetical protein